VLFAALALGTPAGAALSQIIQQTSNITAGRGQADLLNAIRDATGSVLTGSIVLLAVAVVVAVLLAPRGRATGADDLPPGYAPPDGGLAAGLR
jgi:hypothetical protein